MQHHLLDDVAGEQGKSAFEPGSAAAKSSGLALQGIIQQILAKTEGTGKAQNGGMNGHV